MFTDSKVAQIAAVFARHEGGSINILKLMKLMYLVDRVAMERDGDPITFDRMVSMEHGPVLSKSYDLAKGQTKSQDWGNWLGKRWIHNIRLRKKEFGRGELDQLSKADLEIIKSVWEKFGHMDRFELRDYIHDHCPEWKDPGKTSIPIDEREVLLALGKDEEEIDESIERLRVERGLDRVLSGT